MSSGTVSPGRTRTVSLRPASVTGGVWPSRSRIWNCAPCTWNICTSGGVDHSPALHVPESHSQRVREVHSVSHRLHRLAIDRGVPHAAAENHLTTHAGSRG